MQMINKLKIYDYKILEIKKWDLLFYEIHIPEDEYKKIPIELHKQLVSQFNNFIVERIDTNG